MSEVTKRSALFGILSVVLWALMATSMLTAIATIESEFGEYWAGPLCLGSIILNIAGFVLGILGLLVGHWRRGGAPDHERPNEAGGQVIFKVARWARWLSLLGIVLNVFISWPVFDAWYRTRYYTVYPSPFVW
jgi:hypothetical protein